MLWVLNIVIVTFLWGSVLLISSILSLPSPVFVFFRLIFGLLVVFPFAWKKGLKKPDFKSILSGVLLALNWIFLFMSVNRIGPSTADFLYYTAPIISMLISFFLGIPTPLWSWTAAAIAFTGIGLIFSFTPSEPIGMIFALIAAVFYGSLVVLGKHATKNVHPYVLTFNQFLSAIAVTFVFSIPYFKPLSLKEIILLIIAGVLNTGVALLLWWNTLKKVNIRVASVLSYLDPVFALVLSTMFLNYKPTLWNIIGGALIVFSGVLTIFMEVKSQR